MDIVSFQNRIALFLEKVLPRDDSYLSKAMRYSTLEGGKRIRALLAYAVALDEKIDLKDVDFLAGAIECIHAYSLVHDDLPAMDDDALRRGKPSCHIAFDEATAILAGDALNTFAFNLLIQSDFSASIQVQQIACLSDSAGYKGMVSGQSLDMLSTGKQISLMDLQMIHQKKTGALLNAAIMLPVMASVEKQKYFEIYQQISNKIGLAYQVLDDLLDELADNDMLGKTAGKDKAQGKNTYCSLLGIEESKQVLKKLKMECTDLLIELPKKGKNLSVILNYLFDRKY